MNDDWQFDSRRQLECVHLGAHEIRQGDRVRLQPRRRADIFDLALQGKVATVEAIEQDLEERVYFAVVVDDDPGSDLGLARQVGHRFFFALDEVAPLTADPRAADGQESEIR